jgi:hypothetical protein
VRAAPDSLDTMIKPIATTTALMLLAACGGEPAKSNAPESHGAAERQLTLTYFNMTG